MIARVLLHGLVPGDGALGLVLELTVFLAILLAAFALVILSESTGPGRRRKLAWGLAILAVPLVGPSLYLVKRYG